MGENGLDESKLNASIELILDRGLAKPRSVRESISGMLSQVGIRFIFWDMGYSIFFALLTVAIGLAIFWTLPEEYQNSVAVAIAPMLFLLFAMFSEMTERVCGLYEIKQTCHHTVTQTSTLRVIGYSLAGTVFCVVLAASSTGGAYGFMSLLMLCLFALFLCAVLEVCAMRVLRGKWASATYAAAWCIVSMACPIVLGKAWERLLEQMPLAVSIALAFTSILAFAIQTSKTLKEANAHAVA